MGRLILHGAALAGCLALGLLGASAARLDPVAGTLAAALLYLLCRVLGRRLADALGHRRVLALAGFRGPRQKRLRSALEMLDRGHPDVALAALSSLEVPGDPVPAVMATWGRACLRVVTHRGFGIGTSSGWAGVTAGRRRPLPHLERALLAPGFPAEERLLAAEAAAADDASLAAILGVRSLLIGTLLPAVGDPFHPLFPRAEQDLERVLGARYLFLPRLRLERRARSLQPPGSLLPPREEAALLLLVHGRAAAAAALLASADAAGSLSRRGRALRSAALLLDFLRDGGEVSISPDLFRRRTREIFFLLTRAFSMTDGSPHLEALPEGPLRLLRLLGEKRRLVSCLALLRLRRPGMDRALGALARRIAAGGDGSAAPRSARRFLRWWRREGRDVDRATALNLRGLLLLEEGRAREAVAEFEAAAALDPDLEAAAFNHAVALHEAGDEDADAPLREFAGRAGDEGRARLLLGEFLERVDRTGEAEREYRRILDLDPADGEAAHALGRLLLEEGNAAEAMEPLRRALAARSGDPSVLVTLGLAHLDTGRPGEAAPLFRAAVDGTDGDRRERARFLLHVAFREAEDHVRALETLDAVPDRFLRHHEPMLEEAALYLEERSRFDRARRLQERLRELRARRGEL